jgi:hypothetical protein
MPRPRSAREIIDQVISENKTSERLLYFFAALFAVLGVGIVVLGAVKNQQTIALAGSIAAGLFWPTMRLARQTRRENIAIRLLEAPLGRAETAKQAAETVQRLVEEMLQDKTPLVDGLGVFNTHMKDRSYQGSSTQASLKEDV